VRVAIVATCWAFLAACQGPVEGRTKEAQLMAKEPSDVVFGREALKAWAAMSAHDREQARAAFRSVAPEVPEPTLAVIVLDEDLPGNSVASIVGDPISSDRQVLVFSRRTYNDAAFVMATDALASYKTKELLGRFGRLDVTTGATVVSPDRKSLFELQRPDPSLLSATENLTHLVTVATSSESVEVPNLGRGKIYRFNTPSSRK
jgi:hypothetical protein